MPTSFLEKARQRWQALTSSADPAYQQAGQAALDVVAEQYAETTAYNQQLQLDQLQTRIRTLETELVTERMASLKLGRRLEQQAIVQRNAQEAKVRTRELERLREWLKFAENEEKFTNERLHKVQTELRRRITILERTKQP